MESQCIPVDCNSRQWAQKSEEGTQPNYCPSIPLPDDARPVELIKHFVFYSRFQHLQIPCASRNVYCFETSKNGIAWRPIPIFSSCYGNDLHLHVSCEAMCKWETSSINFPPVYGCSVEAVLESGGSQFSYSFTFFLMTRMKHSIARVLRLLCDAALFETTAPIDAFVGGMVSNHDSIRKADQNCTLQTKCRLTKQPITHKLSWTNHIEVMAEKAHQYLTSSED